MTLPLELQPIVISAIEKGITQIKLSWNEISEATYFILSGAELPYIPDEEIPEIPEIPEPPVEEVLEFTEFAKIDNASPFNEYIITNLNSNREFEFILKAYETVLLEGEEEPQDILIGESEIISVETDASYTNPVIEIRTNIPESDYIKGDEKIKLFVNTDYDNIYYTFKPTTDLSLYGVLKNIEAEEGVESVEFTHNGTTYHKIIEAEGSEDLVYSYTDDPYDPENPKSIIPYKDQEGKEAPIGCPITGLGVNLIPADIIDVDNTYQKLEFTLDTIPPENNPNNVINPVTIYLKCLIKVGNQEIEETLFNDIKSIILPPVSNPMCGDIINVTGAEFNLENPDFYTALFPNSLIVYKDITNLKQDDIDNLDWSEWTFTDLSTPEALEPDTVFFKEYLAKVKLNSTSLEDEESMTKSYIYLVKP